jgi:hypothetical protein
VIESHLLDIDGSARATTKQELTTITALFRDQDIVKLQEAYRLAGMPE